MKQILPLLTLLLLGSLFITLSEVNASTRTGYDGITTQWMKIPVEKTGNRSTTQVHWSQMGDGSRTDPGNFRASSSYEGYVTVAKNGTYPNLYPTKARFGIKLDFRAYIGTSNFEHLASGKTYTPAQVTMIDFAGVSYKSDGIEKIETDGANYIKLTTYTGGKPSDWDRYAYCEKGQEPMYYPDDGTKKIHCYYQLEFTLKFTGDVTEYRKIEAKIDKPTINIGETTQASALVKARWTEKDSYDAGTDVTTRSQTTWKSDKKAVATVDSNGKVTGVSPGTANICANWESPFDKDSSKSWDISDCVTITVVSSDEPYIGIEIAPLCYEDGQTNTVEIKVTLYRTDGTSQTIFPKSHYQQKQLHEKN